VSHDQSNAVHSKSKPNFLPTASSTRAAAGTTSLPMPSPGMSAILWRINSSLPGRIPGSPAAGENRQHLRHRRRRAGPQLGRREAADRMRDDGERIQRIPADRRLGPRALHELVGADHRRRYPPPVQLDPVVHTARGAGPSIADGGDDGIARAGQAIEVVGIGHTAGARLAHDDDLAEPVARGELLADEIEQPIAVDLAVVEQAQHLAVEIGDTLGDGDVGRLLRAHGGIEDLERHGISLVTASELRSRLQAGMNAEWPPAPPPATTRWMSSGPWPRCIQRVSSPGSTAPGSLPPRLRSATVRR